MALKVSDSKVGSGLDDEVRVKDIGALRKLLKKGNQDEGLNLIFSSDYEKYVKIIEKYNNALSMTSVGCPKM